MRLRIDNSIKKGLVLKLCDLLLDIVKLMFGGIILTGIIGLVDNMWALITVGGAFIAVFLLLAMFLYVLGHQRKI